ncbi:MAG: hypothetical protein Q4E62_07815 [Sutterellaceae bacterium]|nr:hypothetical protein [Sutterellaceae bacterium]
MPVNQGDHCKTLSSSEIRLTRTSLPSATTPAHGKETATKVKTVLMP